MIRDTNRYHWFTTPIFLTLIGLGIAIKLNATNGQISPKKPNLQTATAVFGTITSTAVPFAGYNCSNIILSASSLAATITPPPPPSGQGDDLQLSLPTPKWTRSVKANGQLKNGQCKYEIIVPANEVFHVEISANAGCGAYLFAVPQLSTWISVKPNQRNQQNFKITQIRCIQ